MQTDFKARLAVSVRPPSRTTSFMTRLLAGAGLITSLSGPALAQDTVTLQHNATVGQCQARIAGVSLENLVDSSAPIRQVFNDAREKDKPNHRFLLTIPLSTEYGQITLLDTEKLHLRKQKRYFPIAEARILQTGERQSLQLWVPEPVVDGTVLSAAPNALAAGNRCNTDSAVLLAPIQNDRGG